MKPKIRILEQRDFEMETANQTTPANQCKVQFRFEKTGEVTVVTGIASIRPGQMVLESTDPDYYPFLIVGNACKHGFEGVNKACDGQRVNARWALVNGTYRGTWIEGGYDYEFLFQTGGEFGASPDSAGRKTRRRRG